LRKPPSIAETIDWARTMLALGVDTLDETVAAATLGVVLKHRADQDRAAGQLHLPQRA
ncbi:MAG: AAA family ATPase, partial [Acidimicrobiia bacterium]